MSFDEKWMKRVFSLAQKGMGDVHPNPMVGAVLVQRDRLVGEGFHARFGGPHAELKALKHAGDHARGATLYVNLEPCSHWGKTPPCVQSVIAAGVKRVVAAMKDPNPLVSGKGFAALKKAGIVVTQGVLETQARHQNRAFITWVTQKRPYVTLKAAASLDGKMASLSGDSRWITGSKAREEGYRWRAQVDAIAVGVNTVLRDNPSLTSHGRGRNPVRIVFDSRLRTPASARLVRGGPPTWILSTERAATRGQAQVVRISADSKKRVHLKKALHQLAAQGISHLLVEGGQTLHQSFLEAGMVDEILWFMAPMMIAGTKRMRDVRRLESVQIQTFGEDVCFHGYVHRPH